MENSYYRPGAERGRRVHALFAAIADRYDLINDLQSLGLHRLWKRRLVAEASVGPGQTALDVCTGTGDLAFRLHAAGARTVGVDFSLPMLRVALRRARSRGISLPFVAADGLRLPFTDQEFDRVTIGYGLRNLPDFEAGLREFHRVTRRGGRLLVLDFGKPSVRWWRACAFAYLRLALPILGKVFCGNAAAYAYILESLRHYPDPAAMLRLLETAGWRQAHARGFLGGVMNLHWATRLD